MSDVYVYCLLFIIVCVNLSLKQCIVITVCW